MTKMTMKKKKKKEVVDPSQQQEILFMRRYTNAPTNSSAFPYSVESQEGEAPR